MQKQLNTGQWRIAVYAVMNYAKPQQNCAACTHVSKNWRIKLSKHTKLIEACKNGVDIQILTEGGWKDIEFPSWNEDVEYRIKPHALPSYIIARNGGSGLFYFHVGPFNTYEETQEFIKQSGEEDKWVVIVLHNPADVPTQGRAPVEPL